jgi:hypothetical protein
MLEDLVARLEQAGIGFELARVTATLDDALRRTGLHERIGADRLHPSVHSGVEAFLRRGASEVASDAVDR